MKACVLAMLCLMLFSGCASTPENKLAKEFGYYGNSCLPTAIVFKEGLSSEGLWAKVLVYNFDSPKKPNGHAVCAYMYPTGSNQLWTYDVWGSYRARAYKNDPLGIAKEAHKARAFNHRVTSAMFLE